MAGRARVPNAKPVTIRLPITSYEAIKEFASRSPAGHSTAAFIRELVEQYGAYCREQLDAGNVGSYQELGNVKDVLSGITSKSKLL